MNISFKDRGDRFRDSFDYIRSMADGYRALETAQGTSRGALDMLPKPTGGKLPLLVTGGGLDKPVMQSLYVGFVSDLDAAPCPMHLGFQSGMTYLRRYLEALRDVGVNHVALNLRLNSSDTETTMKRLADEILPAFAT